VQLTCLPEVAGKLAGNRKKTLDQILPRTSHNARLAAKDRYCVSETITAGNLPPIFSPESPSPGGASAGDGLCDSFRSRAAGRIVLRHRRRIPVSRIGRGRPHPIGGPTGALRRRRIRASLRVRPGRACHVHADGGRAPRDSGSDGFRHGVKISRVRVVGLRTALPSSLQHADQGFFGLKVDKVSRRISRRLEILIRNFRSLSPIVRPAS